MKLVEISVRKRKVVGDDFLCFFNSDKTKCRKILKKYLRFGKIETCAVISVPILVPHRGLNREISLMVFTKQEIIAIVLLEYFELIESTEVLL